MATQEDRSKQINTGTAEGLLAFLEYLTDKGYATGAAVNPLRSAVRQILAAVEGAEYGGVDVRSLDVEAYLDRFENIARGDYKAESLQSYRSRFRRALAFYETFLTDGRPPSLRTSPSRRARADSPPGQRATPPAGSTRRQPVSSAPATAPDFMDYPFPLRAGGVAHLRLPKKLERDDAERLAVFIRALVFDRQGEITSGIADTPEEPA